MWQTLAYTWQACFEQAWAAYAAGSVPIGAVITDSTGTIIARGRNRVWDDGQDGGRALSRSRLAHAEVNALLGLDEMQIDPHTCILYTLVEPCPLCLGALTMANIRCLHYASRDPWAGAADLVRVSRYINSKNIRVVGPPSDKVEAIVIAIQTEFFWRFAGERAERVLDAWRAVAPLGVQYGLDLCASDRLKRMSDEEWPVSAMLDELSRGLSYAP